MADGHLDWKDIPVNKPFNEGEQSSRLCKWLAIGFGLIFLWLVAVLIYQLTEIYSK
ncbi:MAG TPA: hypothetical protein VFQ34_07895 [Nitrospiraceae bacterium]|nr:hypothetical protein [Nitrospiraceae bacterium]